MGTASTGLLRAIKEDGSRGQRHAVPAEQGQAAMWPRQQMAMQCNGRRSHLGVISVLIRRQEWLVQQSEVRRQGEANLPNAGTQAGWQTHGCAGAQASTGWHGLARIT